MVFLWGVHMERGELWSLSSSYEDTNLVMGALPSWSYINLITPQKPHLPFHYGIEVSVCEFGDNKNIQLIISIKPSDCLPPLFLHPLAKKKKPISLNVMSYSSSSFNYFIHLCHHYPPSSFYSPHSLQILLADSKFSLAPQLLLPYVSHLYQLFI